MRERPKLIRGGVILDEQIEGVHRELKMGERIKGHGRWIYCKYCYKNVLPTALEEEYGNKRTLTIVCPICTSGLKTFHR